LLLEEDGLNASWENGVNVSDYLGELGQHDAGDAGRHVPIVFARANNPRLYDISGMGYGDDESFMGGLSQGSSTSPELGHGTDDGVRVVREMSQADFRRRLIEHFSILWRRGEVQWPSRSGVVAWAPL
jgi:hypothetical protein